MPFHLNTLSWTTFYFIEFDKKHLILLYSTELSVAESCIYIQAYENKINP
jgi:hypothetical protein